MFRCFLYLIFTFISSFDAYAEAIDFATSSIRTERWMFGMEAQYLNTEANFDGSGGSFEDLGSGQYYRRLLFEVATAYGFSRKIDLYARTAMARAESFDGTFTRTQTGPVSMTLGSTYLLWRRPALIYASFDFEFPFNRVDAATDEVLTGEGAMELRPGLWLKKAFGRIKSFTHLNFSYRDEGRAHLIGYRFGAEYKWPKLSLGSELMGYAPVIDDDEVDNTSERTQVTNRVNGSSLQFYSVNPSSMALRAWTGYRLSKEFRSHFYISRGVNGKNSAQTLELGIGLKMALSKSSTSPSNSRARRRNKEVETFEVESEKYDADLFEEKKKKPKPRKRKKKKKQDVDKLLRDTEEALDQ